MISKINCPGVPSRGCLFRLLSGLLEHSTVKTVTKLELRACACLLTIFRLVKTASSVGREARGQAGQWVRTLLQHLTFWQLARLYRWPPLTMEVCFDWLFNCFFLLLCFSMTVDWLIAVKNFYFFSRQLVLHLFLYLLIWLFTPKLSISKKL